MKFDVRVLYSVCYSKQNRRRQTAVRSAHKPKDAGSNPALGTSGIFFFCEQWQRVRNWYVRHANAACVAAARSWFGSAYATNTRFALSSVCVRT